MADITQESLKALDDPSKYVRKDGIPVFKAHKRFQWTDDQGRRLDHEKFLYAVTDKDLPDIVNEMLRTEREHGVLPRLTIGHTNPKGPETAQPPLVGAAKNPRVGTFGPMNEPCILADFYFRKEDWDKPRVTGESHVRDLPYRSVEYYPKRKQIAGVALLARDPELDLGMTLYHGQDKEQIEQELRWHRDYERQQYSKDDPCFHYAMGAPMPDMAPAAPPVGGGDDMERYMTHFRSVYPHFDEMHSKYAKKRMEKYGPEGGAGLPPPAGAPPAGIAPPTPSVAPPSPAPPLKPHIPEPPPALGAGGMPGPTDIHIPSEKKKDEPPEETHMARDSELAIQLRKAEEDLALARQEHTAYIRQHNEMDCSARVSELLKNDYVIRDPEGLKNELLELDAAQREKRCMDIAQNYTRMPGNALRIAGGTPQPSRRFGPKVEHHKAAVRLATKEGIEYDEALKRVEAVA